MDEKAYRIRKMNNSIENKNSVMIRSKSPRHREDVMQHKEKLKRRRQKSWFMKHSRLRNKQQYIHKYTLSNTKDLSLGEQTFNNESFSMIGLIDRYGLFLVDLEEEGTELISTSITDDVGYFAKIITNRNFKTWIDNVKKSYEILQSIYNKIYANSKLKLMFIEDKIENFEDIDTFNNYLSKIKITWFNNPVIVF